MPATRPLIAAFETASTRIGKFSRHWIQVMGAAAVSVDGMFKAEHIKQCSPSIIELCIGRTSPHCPTPGAHPFAELDQLEAALPEQVAIDVVGGDKRGDSVVPEHWVPCGPGQLFDLKVADRANRHRR